MEAVLRSYFTTGQIARLCRVSTRTAVKWIDKKLLVGGRIPGCRHRRVTRVELVKFMTVNAMLEGLSTEEKTELGLES